jgi:HSP20 family protein
LRRGPEPASIDVQLDRGMLSIAGERKTSLPEAGDKKAAVHINERFAGSTAC